jgi:competence protein ComFC
VGRCGNGQVSPVVIALTSRLRSAEVVLDLFFPRLCVGCGREGNLICTDCRRQLPALGPTCPLCGRPQADEVICPACCARISPLDSVRSPYRFQGVVRQAVHDLKYRGLRAMARPLGELLAAYLVRRPIEADALVPVPLHRRRLRERGYNQSALICRELSRLCGLPVVTEVVLRVSDTPPQVRAADAASRRANVAGAFVCRDGRLKGKRVIVVDDVCTSGATLESCAAVLKGGGAAYVAGLTVAREV